MVPKMKVDITKEQWIKIRGQGKYRYILFHWIITVALPLGVVLPVLRVLFNKDFILSQFINNVIVNIVIFSAVSIVFGTRKWKKCSNMYR